MGATRGRDLLAGLAGGGGGDLGADPGGDPEALLGEIKGLLEQYLALGPDTPVAQEAQALNDAIDQTMGGGQPPDMGGMAPPPEEGTEPPAEAGAEPPLPEGGAEDMPVEPGGDNTALQEGEQGYSGGDMGEANAAAKDFLTKRNKKAKA